MFTKISMLATAAVIVSLFSLDAAVPSAEAAVIWNSSTVAAPDEPIVQAKTVIVKKNGHGGRYYHGGGRYYHGGGGYYHGGPRHGVWVYNSHKYGSRYAYRHPGYGYYYGGYWYAQPWWTIGGPGVNLCIGC